MKSILKIIVILFYFFGISYSQDRSNNFVSITSNSDYPINRMYLDGSFSPIGWSKNGFFAYAEYAEYTTDDVGAVIENKSAVYIMNTITDEIVAELSNYTRHIGVHITHKYADLKNVSFEEFWFAKQHEITSLLKHYNIISFPDMELRAISTLIDLHGVEVYLVETDWRKADINVYVNYNFKWNIYAARNGRKKIIGTIGSAWSVDEILGYYMSPFENRIVVYLKASFPERMGMLGPDINLYKFIGCHLEHFQH